MIDPRPLVVARRRDDERVAFPAPGGVTPPARDVDFVGLRQRAAVHPDRPQAVAPLKCCRIRSGSTMNSSGSGYRIARGMPIGLHCCTRSLPSAGGCARRRPMCSSGCACGVGAAERAAVRRNVRVERGLPCRREHRKLEAEAAIAAVAAAPAAAETDGVRRPDAREVFRVERHVRVVDLRVTRARARRAGRRLSRTRRRRRGAARRP